MAVKITLKEIENTARQMGIEEALEFLTGCKEKQGLSVNRIIEKYRKKKEAYDQEVLRYHAMCSYEIKGYEDGVQFIAGIDEVGRGPLAGPVVTAAVILPNNIFIPKLNDSKKLSAKLRDELFEIIHEKAIAIGIGIRNEQCIDEINILNATKEAMKDAIYALNPQPDLLLIDAVKLDDVKIKQKNIISGDALSVSIAAASIIAKVTRDRMIEEMEGLYPQYGFAKHKGYGTREHIDAIKKYGICPIHRISFTKNFTA